jgi:hypothetical protein
MPRSVSNGRFGEATLRRRRPDGTGASGRSEQDEFIAYIKNAAQQNLVRWAPSRLLLSQKHLVERPWRSRHKFLVHNMSSALRWMEGKSCREYNFPRSRRNAELGIRAALSGKNVRYFPNRFGPSAHALIKEAIFAIRLCSTSQSIARCAVATRSRSKLQIS